MPSSPLLMYSPLLFCYSAKADIDRRACSVRSRFYIVNQTDLQNRRRPMDCRCCNDWSSSETQLTGNRGIRSHPWMQSRSVSNVSRETFWGDQLTARTPARASNGITAYDRQRILHLKSASRIKKWSTEKEDDPRRIAITTDAAWFCWRCYTKFFYQSTRNCM